MVEILIAAVIGGLLGALGTVAWLKRGGGGSGAPRARERRSGGAAASLQRSILDSLQDGVVVYDEDDRIVFFNPAASEILGVSHESLATGVRTWEPLDAEGRPMVDEERPVAITARTGGRALHSAITSKRSSSSPTSSSTVARVIATPASSRSPGRSAAAR